MNNKSDNNISDPSNVNNREAERVKVMQDYFLKKELFPGKFNLVVISLDDFLKSDKEKFNSFLVGKNRRMELLMYPIFDIKSNLVFFVKAHSFIIQVIGKMYSDEKKDFSKISNNEAFLDYFFEMFPDPRPMVGRVNEEEEITDHFFANCLYVSSAFAYDSWNKYGRVQGLEHHFNKVGRLPSIIKKIIDKLEELGVIEMRKMTD